jgi:hypothetical protein
MRPLNLTIEAIRNVSRTQEFPNKDKFLIELRKIESQCNVENLTMNNGLWAEVSGLLEQYLGDIDQPWKQTVAELYQGRLDFTKYL